VGAAVKPVLGGRCSECACVEVRPAVLRQPAAGAFWRPQPGGSLAAPASTELRGAGCKIACHLGSWPDVGGARPGILCGAALCWLWRCLCIPNKPPLLLEAYLLLIDLGPVGRAEHVPLVTVGEGLAGIW